LGVGPTTLHDEEPLWDAARRDQRRWAGGVQGDPRVHQDLARPAAARPPAGTLAGARRRPGAVPGRFAYVDGEPDGGEVLPLCRLRYAGSASLWGFAIYLASTDGYQDSVLPSGLPVGQGPVKVEVCTKRPSMPTAGLCPPTWISAAI
jgi:hypothetical protein